jgi:hypothetical protein
VIEFVSGDVIQEDCGLAQLMERHVERLQHLAQVPVIVRALMMCVIEVPVLVSLQDAPLEKWRKVIRFVSGDVIQEAGLALLGERHVE